MRLRPMTDLLHPTPVDRIEFACFLGIVQQYRCVGTRV
jgi:hypothetical protein